VAYTILALSVAMLLAFLIGVGGALWSFYERGAERYEKR